MKTSKNVKLCLLILPITFFGPKMFLNLPAAVPAFILTWMVSYSTLEGELQHTGWVKINSGNAGGRCRNIFEQNESYQQYQ
jgi:hypothetical protein